jgi:hypothetical protein
MALSTPVAAVSKRTQLCVETTPGTTPGSPTWKRMPTLMIMPAPKFESTAFRGQGFKYPSQKLKGKESVVFKYEGATTLAELCYIFSSYGKPATITTVGTTAKQWAFVPDPTNPDGGTTYSVQHGDSARAWSFTYARFASVTLNITRDAIKVSGDGLGQYWNKGIAIAANPTIVENVPIIGAQVDVFLDTAYGSIGTTQLTAPYEVEIALPTKYNATFPLNTGAPGHGGDVEIASEPTVKIKLGANAESDALVDHIRGADVLYMRIVATTPDVADSAAPTYYSFQFDMAIQVSDGGDMEESAGAYVANWTNNLVVDTVNGFIWKATIINKTAAL